MAVYKCESCGAPLSALNGVIVSICEYCGTENIITNNDNNFVKEESIFTEDIIVTTVPCIGRSIFEKQIFVIHRTYAEVLDKKTKTLYMSIDFDNVMKYRKALGYSTAIKFQMKNGQKCIVNFGMKNHYDLAMNALNGLIKV